MSRAATDQLLKILDISLEHKEKSSKWLLGSRHLMNADNGLILLSPLINPINFNIHNITHE
jgi:hypothetical protein